MRQDNWTTVLFVIRSYRSLFVRMGIFMDKMFAHDRALKTIYVYKDWTIDNVKPNTDMFLGCNVLTGENGTHYNASHAGSDYACLDETGYPGYFTYKQYESSIVLPQIGLRNISDVYDLHGVKVRTVN